MSKTKKEPMRLVRETTPDGKCKYALVRLDKLALMDKTRRENFRQAIGLLKRAGLLEYGEKESREEFFVLKLKDLLALPALEAYATTALDHANAQTNQQDYDYWIQFVVDLDRLHKRAMKRKDLRSPT